jgi:hypothetical protein
MKIPDEVAVPVTMTAAVKARSLEPPLHCRLLGDFRCPVRTAPISEELLGSVSHQSAASFTNERNQIYLTKSYQKN